MSGPDGHGGGGHGGGHGGDHGGHFDGHHGGHRGGAITAQTIGVAHSGAVVVSGHGPISGHQAGHGPNFANHGQGGSFNRDLGHHVSNLDSFSNARLKLLDQDSVNDQLLLSYDHCDSFDGGNSCLADRYTLVDAVRGTFEDDLYDPNGSRRPLEKRYLTPEQMEIVKRMGDDPNRRLFGFHVSNHGLVFTDQEFERVAKELGCVRIDGVTPNFFSSDETLVELADWNTWKGPFTRQRVPAGFYPNATGSTRIWKQYWQVKHQESHWAFERYGPKHNPDWAFDPHSNTILEVTSVTWYFREACDFETRFHIRVVSMPYLDPGDKRWGYLIEPFKRYQKAAKQLATLMWRRMKAAIPLAIAIQRRGEILRRVRAERDERHSLAIAALRAEQAPVQRQPPVDSCGGRPSGADLGSALAAQPELVRVRLVLPRRK